MEEALVSEPWNEGVRGTQVLPLINLDAKIIRVEAGPGTGKTFGLVRRVQRILHPDGLGVAGGEVLVVAFNRVIATQLKTDIAARLAESLHEGDPIIRTVHALCLEVVATPLRILLPHEREAMIYDVRTEFPEVAALYKNFKKTEQALVDHEAKHAQHMKLWQAARQWLVRHKAQLISDLPGLLLDRLAGGDLKSTSYMHVIVDEFQDLTPGEQLLFVKLRKKGGSFVALGDPRQSIYAFRGNEREGLAKVEKLLEGTGLSVKDVEVTECQRCPKEIVKAANQLMGLYSAKPMVPSSKVVADTHVVVWNTPKREAAGMARAIVHALHSYRKDRHLIMVTRRDFGYWLRDCIAALDPKLKVELNFSESLLETWAVREAFLFFCLRVDPDAPTWRAWLGYKDAPTGKGFAAPERNSAAYLRFLTASKDEITAEGVREMAAGAGKPAGGGATNLWSRAKRFVELETALEWDGKEPETFVELVLADSPWITNETKDAETAKIDMEICRAKARAMLRDVKAHKMSRSPTRCLKEVAQHLRYQIATREPFIPEEASDAQIATLWGAKGITADHVFILGLCDPAIPGTRRDEYPGTDLQYEEEQRRLFYVSITRSKKTLVLSRAKRMRGTDAAQMGLYAGAPPFWVNLEMSRFLRDITGFLPPAEDGDEWVTKTVT